MDRTFNPYSAPQSGSEPPKAGLGFGNVYGYEDQERKVGLVRIALFVFAAALIAAVVSDLMELSFLDAARSGSVTEAEGEANDQRQLAIAVFWGLAYLASVIAIGSFLHRANKNARALAGEGVILEYTPGMTVGWFFVPFLNLWKPYRAVQELFTVSQPGGNGLLVLWWAGWIGMNVIGRISAKVAEDATEIDDFVLANHIDMVHAAVALIATFLVWSVVKSLHRLQRAHHERGAPEMPA